MTQKLTTIGRHRKAFNNEHSPYRIVSYNRPETIQTRKLAALFVYKK